MDALGLFFSSSNFFGREYNKILKSGKVVSHSDPHSILAKSIEYQAKLRLFCGSAAAILD